MYPEELVKPMREELTKNGFLALYSSEDVDTAIAKKGTTLVIGIGIILNPSLRVF